MTSIYAPFAKALVVSAGYWDRPPIEDAGSVYDEGFDARENVRKQSDNPYPKDTGDWKGWDAGWRDADSTHR